MTAFNQEHEILHNELSCSSKHDAMWSPGKNVIMKFLSSFLFAVFLAVTAHGQSPEINIIPKPHTIERQDGHFTLGRNTTVVASTESGRRLARVLTDLIQRQYGFKLRTSSKQPVSNYIE